MDIGDGTQALEHLALVALAEAKSLEPGPSAPTGDVGMTVDGEFFGLNRNEGVFVGMESGLQSSTMRNWKK